MNADPDAYEAGLRAGYAHGYEIGRAHGKAETDIAHVDVAAPRLGGPSREELIARGHIPRDLTRPPALPFRMWTAQEWAKAEARDLPTTEHGHAQWREALAAGRVPADLADAYAQAHPQQPADTRPASPTAGLAVRVTRDVVESGRAIADLHSRLDPAAPVPPAREGGEPVARSRHPELADSPEQGIAR